MTVVTGGYGLPEEGSIVAGGMGLSEQVEGAIVANLSGSGALTATLTGVDNGVPATGGHGGWITIADPPRAPQPIPGVLVANLAGTSTLHAQGSSFDWLLLDDLNNALLLELV